MSLLTYFPKEDKSKSAKKSNAKVGSKRKLSDDGPTTEEKEFESDEPLAKKQRLNKSKSNTSSDDFGAISAIPFPPSKSNAKSKTKTKTKEKSKTKTKTKSVSNDYDSDEEQDIDIEETQTKTKTKSKSKNATKCKADTSNNNSNSNSNSNGDDNAESKDEESIDEDWEAIRSKIDISKLTYAQCDELLHPSWKKQLKNELNKAYYSTMRKKLATEEKSGAQIFPPVSLVFRAFELCPWDNLKVVLLGQDPYHDNGQAEGLCFSVAEGIKIPSSLRNMYKEAGTDFGMKMPNHGSLVEWGEQGVLLLNTALTVKAHKANSHAKFGWQKFTDAVISKISNSHDGVVFILWGKQAQKKKILIDKSKHRIVESAHPSGLSASRGFYGSNPYSKTNAHLEKFGKKPIDWTIHSK